MNSRLHFFENPGPDRRTRAFTLIELLTVIAIIGILAAIIIPVVGRVRDMARQSQCASNMRQTLLALPLFANDNKGLLPECYQTSSVTKNVHAQMAPYFGAPSGLSDDELFKWVNERLGISKCTSTNTTTAGKTWVLGFNSWTMQTVNKPPALSLDSITEPSRLIYVMELASGRVIRTETFNGSLDNDFPKASPRPHRGKVNVGYLDGHVRSAVGSTLTRGDFTRGTPSWRESYDSNFISTQEYDK